MSANIVVPEVGESIVDARVAKWLKKEGDPVAAGDPLVELETDKIDLEVAAPQAGVLDAHRAPRRRGREGRRSARRHRRGGAARRAGRRPAAGAAATAAEPAEQRRPTAERTRATPTARKAAQQNDVDLAQVRGSGDAGRVMRRDVEQAVKQPGGNGRSAAAPARRRRQRPTRRRRPSRSRPSRRIAVRSTARAPRSASACRSAARRSRGASSRRRAPRPCSPPSTRST